MFELKDKICLVTGATRGIGQAIARQIGKSGATVIGSGQHYAAHERRRMGRYYEHQSKIGVSSLKSST